MNLKPLTVLALDWAIRCFGAEHVLNLRARGLRNLEEALELAQAAGVERAQAVTCLCMVYNKEPGEVRKELGDNLLTLTVLAASQGKEPEDLLLETLLRALAKPDSHWAARNKVKNDLGLSGEAYPS